MLPTFFVVGAAKAGTTSLYRYLGDHPEVFASPTKEPFFFSFMREAPNFQGPHDEDVNASIVTDYDEYTSLFCEAHQEQARGDFSNSYLYFRRSAARIADYIEKPKIIIMLRDPVRRAFSHYLQHRMLGHESRSFEEALALEEKRREQNWRWHYQYRRQGRYYKQVRTYLNTFGNPRVKIFLFENFVEETRRTMRRIAGFLNVDERFYDDYTFQTHNATKLPKSEVLHCLFRRENAFRQMMRMLTPLTFRRWAADFLESLNYSRDQKPSLDPNTERELRREFHSTLGQLEDLIDKDLSAWKKKRSGIG